MKSKLNMELLTTEGASSVCAREGETATNPVAANHKQASNRLFPPAIPVPVRRPTVTRVGSGALAEAHRPASGSIDVTMGKP